MDARRHRFRQEQESSEHGPRDEAGLSVLASGDGFAQCQKYYGNEMVKTVTQMTQCNR